MCIVKSVDKHRFGKTMIGYVTIEHLPYEVLSVIFGWISFDQLHRNVKLVCKKWYSSVLMDYSHPRLMLIDGKNKDVALSRIASSRPHIFSLTFSNVDCSAIPKFFEHQFPNLKTLSVVWKWPGLSPACKLSTSSLSNIIDRCPKLDRIYLKHCFIYDSMSLLVEKVATKRIRSVSILNKYQFLDEIDRFYELENLKELRISSSSSAEAVRRVCQINGSSLLSLGVHIDRWSSCAQKVEALRSISTCRQLVNLHLGGNLQGTENWAGIANLSELRFLSIEVDRMSTEAFVNMLGYSFIGRLLSLKVRWNRRVDVDELRRLNSLLLPRLSLAFAEDADDEASFLILAAIVNLVWQNHVLRKLKIEMYFYDVGFLIWLCRSAAKELRSVKIRQICDSLNFNSVYYDLQQVSKLISFGYNLKYSVNESVLEVVITKNRL